MRSDRLREKLLAAGDTYALDQVVRVCKVSEQASNILVVVRMSEEARIEAVSAKLKVCELRRTPSI